MGVIFASGANATSHETQLAQLDRPLDTARQARAASRILLPADVTDREIVLACRLLGENARGCDAVFDGITGSGGDWRNWRTPTR